MPRRVYDSSTSSESLDLFVNFLSCGPLSRAIRLIECIMCRNGNRNRNRNRSRECHSTLEGFDVEVLEPLGEGGFGRVFRCRDCNTGRIVAVKEIAILDLYEGVPSSIIREVSLLKELHHDNIVRLLNVMSRDNKYVNLVFEHLDCDLYQYITDPCYSKDSITRKSFLYQILSAVTYCHTHRVLHRDLKPRNLLIDLSKMTIKLADFGLAREFGEPDMLYTQKIATRWYRAPEILLKSRKYSTPIDLWSVGCIFGEMVIGQPIFRALNCHDELEAIFRMLGTPTEETWPGVTKLSTHLKNYAKFDPLDLSTIFADLEPDGLNLLSMMLCLDPNKRISAEAALQHAYFNDMNLVSHLLLS